MQNLEEPWDPKQVSNESWGKILISDVFLQVSKALKS